MKWHVAIWRTVNAAGLSLKGWRTLALARLMTFCGIVAGVAAQLDWLPILRDNFPALPGWAVAILAGVLMEYMRRITTTPMGKQ